MIPTKKKTEKADRGQCFFCHSNDHMFRDCTLRLKEEEERFQKMLEMSRKTSEESTSTLKKELKTNPPTQLKPALKYNKQVSPSKNQTSVKIATPESETENPETFMSDNEELSE